MFKGRMTGGSGGSARGPLTVTARTAGEAESQAHTLTGWRGAAMRMPWAQGCSVSGAGAHPLGPAFRSFSSSRFEGGMTVWE